MNKQLGGLWRTLNAVREEVTGFCQDLPKGKLVKPKNSRTNGSTKTETRSASAEKTTGLATQVVVEKTPEQPAKSVEERAREIWLEEGCPDGRAHIHWAMAEEELGGKR